MAVIAEGGPAGRGLADYIKWRDRKKLLTGQSGPPTRQGYRHHPGGYVIPANASLTPESQAARDYQGFVSEGNPHTPYNYPMTSAGPDVIAKQDYERRTNIEPFSWYKGNKGWFTQRPISNKLKSIMRMETGAAATPQELKTFMGMPVKGGIQKGINRADDTAEWNPQENIYPRFMIDQLLQQGVITIDEIFDMGASDGDSWKVIPKGLGRMDEYRRS